MKDLNNIHSGREILEEDGFDFGNINGPKRGMLTILIENLLFLQSYFVNIKHSVIEPKQGERRKNLDREFSQEET